jgi:hypothetical protein
MNELFEDFAKAHAMQNGYLLAQTLSPVPPPGQPHRLRSVWQSTNAHSVKGDIKHFIKTNTMHRTKLSADELNGWVEVYCSYWNAVGEIVAGETGRVSPGSTVSVRAFGVRYSPLDSLLGPNRTMPGRT